MIHFGTGGWRAIIGDEFTKANIQLVAKAVAQRIKDEKVDQLPVIVGYDRRFLSREAMIWIGEVLASNGIKAMLVGESSPTPLIMYYTMVHHLKYGMMVTASHNPSLYNGIKVITEEGRDANETVTGDLEQRIRNISENDTTAPVRSIEELKEEGLIVFFNPIDEYLDAILGKIDVFAIRNAHLRIAIDPLYGVSMRSLNTIFSTARCDIHMLHAEHDTLFAGKMPSPDESTVRTLQNYVTDYKFDMGIATDGDADRIGLIDDEGRYITANEILCILYYYFLEYKGMRTPVVKNLATTTLLNKIAQAYGQTCYEVPVGFKHISAKMAETGAYIGGESSGGLTVMGHINGKDAIYAASLLVETIAKTGKKPSLLMKEVSDRFGSYKTCECNVTFHEDRKQGLINRIYAQHDIPDFGLKIISESYEDGCKVQFEDGWILIRFSGTEPLLRIFCEFPEDQYSEAERLCQAVRDYYEI
ncbi:MAG: phosphoglucomutase/phosphomannomutase family protein [Eubacteriales bacterium]|nr:phosphoglucomutase/phosphomannomutase family protein [Eubacteriales bacterium]